jgi:hypothetical protein
MAKPCRRVFAARPLPDLAVPGAESDLDPTP